MTRQVKRRILSGDFLPGGLIRNACIIFLLCFTSICQADQISEAQKKLDERPKVSTTQPSEIDLLRIAVEKLERENADLKQELADALAAIPIKKEPNSPKKNVKSPDDTKLVDGMDIKEASDAVKREYQRMLRLDPLNTHLSNTSDATNSEGNRVMEWEIHTPIQTFYISATFGPDGKMITSTHITHNYFEEN